MNRLTAILTLICSLALTVSVRAAEPAYQSHQSIRDAARIYLESLPEIKQHSDALIDLGHLDSRLTLQQCAQPLEAFMAPGSRPGGKTTVGIRCQAPRPWALYLPVSITVHTTVYQAARPLPRDHTLGAQDIEAVKLDMSRLQRGYFTDKAELIGKQTRQPIRQGQVLNPGLVKFAHWVKRGEQVVLVAQSERFSVRMQGEALANGSQGEQVRVKNLSSGRIVDGIVTQRGVVSVIN